MASRRTTRLCSLWTPSSTSSETSPRTDALVRDGVPAQAISVIGIGEQGLLVPTGDGVREPQNRRVEIVIQ
jgi:hypothetical protein